MDTNSQLRMRNPLGFGFGAEYGTNEVPVARRLRRGAPDVSPSPFVQVGSRVSGSTNSLEQNFSQSLPSSLPQTPSLTMSDIDSLIQARISGELGFIKSLSEELNATKSANQRLEARVLSLQNDLRQLQLSQNEQQVMRELSTIRVDLNQVSSIPTLVTSMAKDIASAHSELDQLRSHVRNVTNQLDINTSDIQAALHHLKEETRYRNEADAELNNRIAVVARTAAESNANSTLSKNTLPAALPPPLTNPSSSMMSNQNTTILQQTTRQLESKTMDLSKSLKNTEKSLQTTLQEQETLWQAIQQEAAERQASLSLLAGEAATALARVQRSTASATTSSLADLQSSLDAVVTATARALSELSVRSEAQQSQLSQLVESQLADRVSVSEALTSLEHRVTSAFSARTHALETKLNELRTEMSNRLRTCDDALVQGLLVEQEGRAAYARSTDLRLASLHHQSESLTSDILQLKQWKEVMNASGEDTRALLAAVDARVQQLGAEAAEASVRVHEARQQDRAELRAELLRRLRTHLEQGMAEADRARAQMDALSLRLEQSAAEATTGIRGVSSEMEGLRVHVRAHERVLESLQKKEASLSARIGIMRDSASPTLNASESLSSADLPPQDDALLPRTASLEGLAQRLSVLEYSLNYLETANLPFRVSTLEERTDAVEAAAASAQLTATAAADAAAIVRLENSEREAEIVRKASIISSSVEQLKNMAAEDAFSVGRARSASIPDDARSVIDDLGRLADFDNLLPSNEEAQGSSLPGEEEEEEDDEGVKREHLELTEGSADQFEATENPVDQEDVDLVEQQRDWKGNDPLLSVDNNNDDISSSPEGGDQFKSYEDLTGKAVVDAVNDSEPEDTSDPPQSESFKAEQEEDDDDGENEEERNEDEKKAEEEKEDEEGDDKVHVEAGETTSLEGLEKESLEEAQQDEGTDRNDEDTQLFNSLTNDANLNADAEEVKVSAD